MAARTLITAVERDKNIPKVGIASVGSVMTMVGSGTTCSAMGTG